MPLHSHDILVQLAVALHVAITGLVAVELLHERRTPAATVAWIAILFALPYLGVALYFFAGAPRKRGRRLAQFLESQRLAIAAPDGALCPAAASLLTALRLPPATTGNRVTVCRVNEHAAGALIDVIDSSRERLFFSVFSLGDDAAGRDIARRLAARAEAGVAVRVLIDGFGSKELRDDRLAAIKRHGGRVARFRPLIWSLPRRGSLNYRNHRKMVVADGRHAWIGGRNMAEKYLASRADGRHWVDLSLAIDGPASAVLEAVCAADWAAASGERVELRPLESGAPTGDSCVQVLPSGPDLDDDTYHALLMHAAVTAVRRIWIVSPFFVPDEALHATLKLACRRGVDVCVVTPRRSHQRFADWVRRSYLIELAEAGGRVLLFERSVLHAKAVIVDDCYALVGSANLDMRSLFTNHEIGALLYTPADIEAVAEHAQAFMKGCTADVASDGFAGRVASGALRVFSPLV